MDLFAAIFEYNLEGDVISCTSIISACDKSSQWIRALQIFGDLRDLQLSVVTFNALISALSKGAWPAALGVLGQLDDWQLQPDVITFNSLISAVGSEWQLAMELEKMLMEQQLNPNLITYNSLLEACRQAAEWQLALMLLEEMKRKLDVSIVTYTTAISACAAAVQWKEALDLVQEAGSKKITPTVFLYNASITACDEHWQEALELFYTLEGAWYSQKSLYQNLVVDFAGLFLTLEQTHMLQGLKVLFARLGSGSFHRQNPNLDHLNTILPRISCIFMKFDLVI